jgi:hypothetical protein
MLDDVGVLGGGYSTDPVAPAARHASSIGRSARRPAKRLVESRPRA